MADFKKFSNEVALPDWLDKVRLLHGATISQEMRLFPCQKWAMRDSNVFS